MCTLPESEQFAAMDETAGIATSIHVPNQPVTCIEFSVNGTYDAPDWHSKARALGIRIDSVPTWRVGRVACFVALGTATVFISQAHTRATAHSLVSPRPADLKLIEALKESGLIATECEQPPEVAA